jgi:mevalonate kinase
MIDLDAKLEDLQAEHPLGAATRSVFSALGISHYPPLKIRITSTIPLASGLGSGAAVSVALIRALSLFLGHPLPDEQVNQLAFEVEKIHHGTPSGIDNTVVTYNTPVYYVKGQPIRQLRLKRPLTFVIGDTGIPSPTKETVADVRRGWLADRQRYERIFDEIGEITQKARKAIENGHPAEVGSLMDANQKWLAELRASSLELEQLVQTARQAGALGAKLSGGGRGGNMIALVEEANAPAVAESLTKAGAVQTITTQV